MSKWVATLFLLVSLSVSADHGAELRVTDMKRVIRFVTIVDPLPTVEENYDFCRKMARDIVAVLFLADGAKPWFVTCSYQIEDKTQL